MTNPSRGEGAAQRAARMEQEAKARGEPSFEDLLEQHRMATAEVRRRGPVHQPKKKPKEPEETRERPMMSAVAQERRMMPSVRDRVAPDTTQQAILEKASDYLESIRDQWPGNKPSVAQRNRAIAYAEQQVSPGS